VALTGGMLTFVALLFGAAPLLIPGVAFTLLGVLMPLWVTAGARGAGVRRRFDCDRVIEGEPVEATIEVHSGRWGLPGGEVLDALADAPVSLPRRRSAAAAGALVEVRIVARAHRRGVRRLQAPSLVLGDALGLARVTRAGGGGVQELLVLPRTEPVTWLARGGGTRLDRADARARAELPAAAVDVDGLRPYRQGTPASRIHWSALARGAGLLERQLRADGDTRPLVALDARCSGPSEELEAAVRAAASLALELARTGGCRLLLGGERRAVAIEPELASWPGAHARLALVQGGPRARAPVLGAGVTLGQLFYVAAGPLGRLPPALTGAGGADWVLVLPAPLRPAAPASACFEVADCRGYALRARSRWAGAPAL
jgi:uncharacterized protein (DUF58 family)